MTDEEYSYDYEKVKRSWGRSRTNIRESLQTTTVGSDISAGGNLTINSQLVEAGIVQQDSGKVTVTGSQLSAGGAAVISGDGVTLQNVTDVNFNRTESIKKGFLGLSRSASGQTSREELIAGSVVKTDENDLSLISSNNIKVLGSNLDSGGNVRLQAEEQVLVSGVVAQTTTESFSESSGLFSGGSLYSSEEERDTSIVNSVVGSEVRATGNVIIDAGSASIMGSDIIAEEGGIGVRTDIGDIEVTSLAGEENSTHYEEQISVGLGDVVKGLSSSNLDGGRLQITLAEASYDEIDQKSSAITQRSSNLVAGGDVILGSVGDVVISGSNVAADVGSDAVINADGSLDRGENSGDGNGTVVLRADGDVSVTESRNSVEETVEQTHGSIKLSVVVQHAAVEVARAAQAVDDAKDQVKEAEQSLRRLDRDVDNLGNRLSQLQSDYDKGVPGVDYADIESLQYRLGELKDDRAFYVAGIALAGVNLVSKTTALLQQTKAAASSAGTYGFDAGVQLEISGEQSNSFTSEDTAVGSSLSGANVLIESGTDEGNQVLIQGSSVIAENVLQVDTHKLNVLSSTDTRSSQSSSDNVNIRISQTVYGVSAGGPSINASYSHNESRSNSTEHTNSELSGNAVILNTEGDTNIAGGNVHAGSLLVTNIGGDLNIESQQDISSSRELGYGLSGGVSLGAADTTSGANQLRSLGTDGSVTGASGGINASAGRSFTRETIESSLTSGGVAQVNVEGNTHLAGAILATIDEEGNDLGNLTLNTGSLSFVNRTNESENRSLSGGISTSVGFEDKKDSTGQPNKELGSEMNINTSSLQVNSNNEYDRSSTLATLGQGDINVADADSLDDLNAINRDVTNTVNELFSIDSGVSIDATLDHRLLSEDGRKEIKEDIKRTELLGESIVDIVTEDSVALQDTFQHIGDVQKDFDVQKLLATQDGGENAKILNNLGAATPEEKDKAINAYAQAYADVYDLSLKEAKIIATKKLTPEGNFIKGGHTYDEKTGKSTIYVNDPYIDNAEGAIKTTSHEVVHAQIAQDTIRDRGEELNEEYADVRAEISSDNYDFNFSENGLGTVNTGNINTHQDIASSQEVRDNTEEYESLDPSDLDNDVFFLHGTGSSIDDVSAELVLSLHDNFNDDTVHLVGWSGENTVEARQEGALNLLENIRSNITEGELTHIVAHSHGGNVSNEYSHLALDGSIDSVLLLGTPSRDAHRFNFSALSDDATFINAYDNSDQVQVIGGIDTSYGLPNIMTSDGFASRTINNIRVENLEVEPRNETRQLTVGAVTAQGNTLFDHIGSEIIGDHTNLDTAEIVEQVFEQSGQLNYDRIDERILQFIDTIQANRDNNDENQDDE